MAFIIVIKELLKNSFICLDSELIVKLVYKIHFQMSQQKLDQQNLFDHLQLQRSSSQNGQLHDDDRQLFINKEDFSRILEQIVQKQQKLQQEIQNLQAEVRSLRNVQKACSIFGHNDQIMSTQQEIKDKMLQSLKQYCKSLEQQCGECREQATTNQQFSRQKSIVGNKNMLMMHIDQLSTRDDRSLGKGGNYEEKKKKICLKKRAKNMKQNNQNGLNERNDVYLKDLEVGRLSSQLSQLKNKMRQYEAQIAILLIQNQHLLAETETIYRRQRLLHQSSANQSIYLHQKHSARLQHRELGQFLWSEFPQQISRLEQNDIGFKQSKPYSCMPVEPLEDRGDDRMAPPITPHFSREGMNQSYFPKNYTKKATMSIVDELMQVFSQAGSGRLQSLETFEDKLYGEAVYKS